MTDHEVLRESSGSYVLGTLSDEERIAFETHLASCAECAAEVRALSSVVEALPHAVPQVDPHPALRARVLAAATGDASDRLASVVPMASPTSVVTGAFGEARARASSRAWWLSTAAMLGLAVGLGRYSYDLHERVKSIEAELRATVGRLEGSERQMAAAASLVQSAQIRMAVLTAPDLKQVNLAGQAVAPRAAGRAFWSRSTGLVFAATDLPALPPGRTYQLWYLQPRSSPPTSAGLVKPDAAGRVASAFDVQPTAAPSGLALSIEPEGGVPAPTGDLYLVGLAQ